MDSDTSKLTTLEYEVRDQVATIWLNRPRAMNAINPPMLDEMELLLDRAMQDEVKAIVFRGRGGRAFSAGVDLKHFHEHGVMDDTRAHTFFNAHLRDVFLKVENTKLPVIAAIQGYALAGGLELALSCDFILCTDTSQIADQHANFGLMAGGGGTQRLPRRIGAQRAKELLYTGRRMGGQEAVATGLALASYPDEAFDAGIESLLAQLRSKSRVGMGYMKDAVQRGMELPLREALDIERLLVQEYFTCHRDASQGVADFNQKKKSSAL